MTIEDHKVTDALVVIHDVTVLTSGAERQRFSNDVGSDLTTMIGTGPAGDHAPGKDEGSGTDEETPEATLVSVDGNRIHIAVKQSEPSSSTIEMDYPDFGDLDRLAKVAGTAISISLPRRRMPTGIEYELTRRYRHTGGTNADQYLADRLYGRRDFGFGNLDLAGGSATIFLGESEQANEQWRFIVRPVQDGHPDDGVELRVRLILDRAQVPRRLHILASLHEIWKRSLEFAASLDAGT